MQGVYHYQEVCEQKGGEVSGTVDILKLLPRRRLQAERDQLLPHGGIRSTSRPPVSSSLPNPESGRGRDEHAGLLVYLFVSLCSARLCDRQKDGERAGTKQEPGALTSRFPAAALPHVGFSLFAVLCFKQMSPNAHRPRTLLREL